jgi:hypothetical protein
MSKQLYITYSVQFETTLSVPDEVPQDELEDWILENIDIPENPSSSYVSQSLEVDNVQDQDSNPIDLNDGIDISGVVGLVRPDLPDLEDGTPPDKIIFKAWDEKNQEFYEDVFALKSKTSPASGKTFKFGGLFKAPDEDDQEILQYDNLKVRVRYNLELGFLRPDGSLDEDNICEECGQYVAPTQPLVNSSHDEGCSLNAGNVAG